MDFSCKAQYTGIGQFFRCLEDDKASSCSFAAPLGSTYLCKSPHWANLYTKHNITVQENLKIQEKEDQIRMIS